MQVSWWGLIDAKPDLSLAPYMCSTHNHCPRAYVKRPSLPWTMQPWQPPCPASARPFHLSDRLALVGLFPLPPIGLT